MSFRPYDPERHDTQLSAVFERREVAERARDALLGAGLPRHAIEVVGAEAAQDGEGFWDVARRLFAPDDETQALRDALRNGRAMLIVHPESPSARQTAIGVLERSGPVDVEERDEPGRPELNHASMSRADLEASTPRAPYPAADAALPEPAPPPAGTTYTYGVPENVAHAMTVEEQVLAQAQRVEPREDQIGEPTDGPAS